MLSVRSESGGDSMVYPRGVKTSFKYYENGDLVGFNFFCGGN